jgi:hypothetical protein
MKAIQIIVCMDALPAREKDFLMLREFVHVFEAVNILFGHLRQTQFI